MTVPGLDPYRPPAASIRPARCGLAGTANRRYRAVILILATLCLVAGVWEWAFTIPFNRTYFPRQHRPRESWWAAGWSLLGGLGLLGWATLLVSQRWRPGGRPRPVAKPTCPEA